LAVTSPFSTAGQATWYSRGGADGSSIDGSDELDDDGCDELDDIASDDDGAVVSAGRGLGIGGPGGSLDDEIASGRSRGNGTSAASCASASPARAAPKAAMIRTVIRCMSAKRLAYPTGCLPLPQPGHGA